MVPGPGQHPAAPVQLARDRAPPGPHRGPGRPRAGLGLHQRLVDEEGLGASVASLRRYLRANFADEVRWGEVVIWRPPVDPGDEGQVDYGYLGNWLDPSCGRRRRVWAFSMVLAYCRHLFVYRVLKMDQQTWVDAHVAAFSFFGGSPAGWCLKMFRGTFSGLCGRRRYVPGAVLAQ